MGAGAVMGWPPRVVYEMTVPEFWAAWEGYKAANSAEDDVKPLTRGEYEAAKAEREKWHQAN